MRKHASGAVYLLNRGQYNTGLNFKFTRSIGVNLDLAYSKQFTNDTYDKTYFPRNAPGQTIYASSNFDNYINNKQKHSFKYSCN